MKIFTVVLISFLLSGCNGKAAEKVTSTTVSVYLNESNCTIYEKIMSGALADHQIIFMETPSLISLFKTQKAQADLIKFYIDTYSPKRGLLSSEDKETLSRLQNESLTWAQMTVEQQKFVTDLVFKGCTDGR